MADLDLGVFGGSTPSRSPITVEIPVVPATTQPQVPDELRALEPAPASTPDHVGLLNAETEQQVWETARSVAALVTGSVRSLGHGLRGLASRPSSPVSVDRLKLGVAAAVAVNLALVVWMVLPHGGLRADSMAVVAPVAVAPDPSVRPVAIPVEPNPAPSVAAIELTETPVAMAELPSPIERTPAVVAPGPVVRRPIAARETGDTEKRAQQQERDLDAFFETLAEKNEGGSP